MDKRTYFNQKRPVPMEPPTIREESGESCPHCGCKRTFIIQIKFKKTEGEGMDPISMVKTDNPDPTFLAVYLGCPACTFASPAMIMEDRE